MPDRQAWAALALAGLMLLLPVLRRSLPAETEPGLAPPARGAARLLYGLPRDPNPDDALALEALPGIGPGLARGIVAGRPFCSVEALRRVRGIGPSRLARIRGHLAIERLPAACDAVD
jgi:competence protein ComEA